MFHLECPQQMPMNGNRGITGHNPYNAAVMCYLISAKQMGMWQLLLLPYIPKIMMIALAHARHALSLQVLFDLGALRWGNE